MSYIFIWYWILPLYLSGFKYDGGRRLKNFFLFLIFFFVLFWFSQYNFFLSRNSEKSKVQTREDFIHKYSV